MSHAFWPLAAAVSLVLAGCAGAGMSTGPGSAGINTTATPASAPAPDRPGTRLTIRNPNPEKWTVVNRQTSANRQQRQTIWACRPLACAGKAAVGIQTSPSPTRDPSREALQRIAKMIPAQAKAQDIMMEAASEGEERVAPLSTKITELRTYPAIVTELKRTSRGKVTYVYRADMFAGLFIIRIISSSTDRGEAKRNFATFLAAIDVLDVPPGATPDPAAPAIQETTALQSDPQPSPPR